MTVLAARIDREAHRAWMASDSEVVASGLLFATAAKITRIGAALVGCCGSPSGARYLRGRRDPLDRTAGHDATVAWADDLVRGWRAWAVTGRLANEGHSVSGWALIATPWGLWHVGCWGDISEIADDYAAIGAGAGPALGVLWYTREGRYVGPLPERRLTAAIHAAIAHSEGCGGDVRIEETAAVTP